MLFRTPDDQLMERVGKGDDSAFRSLFDRHGARVLGYCRRFMGDTFRGEDMAQATWMKVIKAAPSYRGEDKFLSWVLMVARNTCLSEIRLSIQSAEVFLADQEFEDSAVERDSFENQVSQRETLDELKEKIEALPDAQRIVLTLWMSDELSYEQIAGELKISLPAVKSLLFRARKSLEKVMRDQHEMV